MDETKIASLILKARQKLISILIPKIIDIVITESKIDPNLIMKIMTMDKESAKQGGIDEILKQAGKIGICIPAGPLKKITDLRNSMMGTLNAASTTINTLSSTLDPLKTISDTASTTISTADIAIPIAKIAVSLLPTPVPPIPHPAIAAGQQIQTVEEIIKTLKFVLNGFKNQIDSIQGAISSVNPTLTTITNLFKVIDKYLIGCNINATNATNTINATNATDIANNVNLTPLNPYLQALDNAQKQQVLDAQNVNAVDFPSSVYKGFTLDVIKEPFSPTVNRVKAVAKNPQGIVLLQTPLSFTTAPQTLISNIKLIIDLNPNLKAQ